MTVRLGGWLASCAGVPHADMLGGQASAVCAADAGDECLSPERSNESDKARLPRIITNLVPTQILAQAVCICSQTETLESE